MNERPHVIVHPSDLTQSDWVRCILPFMQFMGPNDRQIFPSVTQIVCSNKDFLKRTSIVVIQRPTSQVRMNMASMYAQLKKECGFKLVTDIDDLQWELSPIIKEYAKDIPNVDEMVKSAMKKILPLFDTVVCSTRYLANRLKSDIGVNAVVMPNGVSRSLFGIHRRTSAFSGKPRVMYAGNAGHCTEQNLGDFVGPWVPWLRKRIEEGSIEFYAFGEPPFLQDLKGKYTSIPFTRMLEFPAVVASYRPDFYLAPLCNINFNKAKSDLKLKEAAALDAVFLGSDFSDSPYSYAPKGQLVGLNDTVEILDAKFEKLCEPENFMAAINWQKQCLEEKHWLHEDHEFQKRFVSAYFG